MPLRPCQPMDPSISRIADEQLDIYYRSQPMPNFLFDADGQRRLLSLDEPCADVVHQQWVQHYAEQGGEVEPVPPNDSQVSDDAESCDDDRHRIQIVDPWERGVADVNCVIHLADGREINATTDDQGYVDIPPDYRGEVEILIEDQPFDVIEASCDPIDFEKQEGYSHGVEDAYLTGQMVFRI